MQRTAEAVDVGTLIGILGVQSLFRGHVIDRPHHRSGSRQFKLRRPLMRFFLFLLEPCQPQIENLDHALLVEQQVGRLDVPMDDAFVVGVFQTSGRLQDEIDRLGNR